MHTTLGRLIKESLKDNEIKRIRRYISKREKISKYTKQQIQWLENNINSTPMKCLGYHTPIEMMERGKQIQVAGVSKKFIYYIDKPSRNPT